MTCKEIHDYFESDPNGAVRLLQKSAEFSEHATECPECNRFVTEHRELAESLHRVRDSAPEIPASLDAAVLVRYRSFMSERWHTTVPVARGIGLRKGFGWVAAAAFALVVALGATFFLIPARPSRVHQTVKEQRLVVNAPVAASAIQPIVTTQKPLSKTPKSFAAPAKHVSPTKSAPLPEASFSAGFQGLMYCDQLSCPDTMDVIRMQLPSPRFSSGSPMASEFVYADVLVGSDGIARGIRVVE